MKARDLMIPISDCPRLAEDRNIYDAVVLLEAFRQRYDRWAYRPRGVLVHDADFMVIGHLRHADMLRALAAHGVPATGAMPAWSSIWEQAEVWKNVLNHLHSTARSVRVKEAMHVYSEMEYVDGDALLEEALARLMAGPYLNLVVRSQKTPLGILRQSDVFERLCRDIKLSGMH